MNNKISSEELDKYFIDWENYVFGYGYGTGDKPVLNTIKKFFEMCNKDNFYSYSASDTTDSSIWLLINIFCHNNIIEYGGSPRNGWLTLTGQALKSYIDTRSIDQLYNLITAVSWDYQYCVPGEGGCLCEIKSCVNPFFREVKYVK